jgi:hypothetical protein
MPAQLFSLRMADPAGDEGLRDNMVHVPGGPVSQATFVGENGEALGEPVELGHFDSVHLEHPGEDGAIDSRKVAVPPVFTAEPHDAATGLAIATPSGFVAQILLTDLPTHPASLPAPQVITIGPEDAAFVFPVVAERFEHLNQFLTRVQELRDWIIARPPFNEDAVRDRFALRALFWPSDPKEGLFATNDAQCNNRLFFGDRAAAKQLLKPWLDGDKPNLILINSEIRGGAGGVPGFSAWTSTKAEGGEDWQAVGLHEIGHAFGLGDEYLDESRQAANPTTLEPNVSRAARADQTPWHSLINVAGTLSPSHPAGTQDTASADTIGTFQGARYRTDLYRPMAHCLMRETTSDFCTICQKQIRTALGL